MSQFISGEDLRSWLGNLAQERSLIAPTRSDGLVLFGAISRAEEIALDYDNTLLSPKGHLFPATKALFTIERKEGDIEMIPTSVEGEAVIFGIRPCDALGLKVLDRPFLAEPADALYQQRRARTALIGLSCHKASPECFCTSLGTGPDDPSNVDILLTGAGEGYIVQAVTERGKALLATAPLVETEVAAPPPPSPTPVPAEAIAEVASRVFDAPYWARLADRCIHCNLCAYVCPVCYCFDIRDHSYMGRMERMRTWESCQSPGFSRIAGGHEPRDTKGARLRQRFYHKLLYMPEKFGVIGCTGCGRCVTSCPVNIDIREVISEMQRLGASSAS